MEMLWSMFKKQLHYNWSHFESKTRIKTCGWKNKGGYVKVCNYKTKEKRKNEIEYSKRVKPIQKRT